MRVVHVIDSYEIGLKGNVQHVLTLTAAQKARGLGVAVITDGSGLLSSACHQQGIPVIVMPGIKHEEKGPARPPEETLQALMDQFRSLAADVVHCHTDMTGWPAIHAANRLQVPCIFTLHYVSDRPWGKVRRTSGLRFTVITVSSAAFAKLKSEGMSEPDLYYVPNGTPAAPPADRPEPPPSHRPGLIFVGTLARRKGIDLAILLMAELRRRLGTDCPSLDIYGADGNLAFLQEMTTVLQLEDIVRFRGVRPGILQHCASTDVLLVTSRLETGPLVVLEAMSRGMPIVTTDVGEVREMLPDHRYGRIVPVDSIAALADATESLRSDIAAGNFDPGLLMERHRSCYSSEKMAERIEAIYRRLLRDPEPYPAPPAAAGPSVRR